jgi:hypothetical protein
VERRQECEPAACASALAKANSRWELMSVASTLMNAMSVMPMKPKMARRYGCW